MNRHQVEAAVVAWWASAHQVPAGGKVEAFNQGHKGRGLSNTWEVFVSDAADVIVDRGRVWTYARRGEVTIYSADNEKLATVSAPAKHGAGIRLTQTAPWNPALKNYYRTRYAEAGGRYFRVAAEDLNGLWFVEEINQDGQVIGDAGGGIAMNLDEARSIIATAVAP